MTKTLTKYTIAAAARYANKSPTTIRKHIKDGELSVELLNNGKKRIDVSELHRVYGDDCMHVKHQPVQSESNSVPNSSGDLGLDAIKAQLAKEIDERERERKLYEKQIETLEAALEKSQEGHNRTTLLLKHHSEGTKEWEPILQKLQAELSILKQGQDEKAQRIRKRYEHNLAELSRELAEEREKPLWRRLFTT